MLLRRAVLAIVLLAVGAYYFWGVRAAGYPFRWGQDLDGYYDLLARGFAGGHLYVPIQPSPELLGMPDPWDPSVDEKYKMHDMVLFGRHYYLYFGAAPAVLLFYPWRLVTGHDLPENFALFVLCFGGFVFAAATLLKILDSIGARPPLLLLALMLAVLGLCQSVPYLLNRVWVYEIAIGAGYFFLSGAFFFLTLAASAGRQRLWAAVSGAMFGLAMGSRPHLVFAAAIAGLFLASRKGPAARRTAAFVAGFLTIALAIGIYNYERFGNPFEFGFRYQLAGPGQNEIGLSLSNLPAGAFYMLLCPPLFTPVFPWVRMVLRHAWALPPRYFVEPTVGALWLAPFAVLAACLPRRAGPWLRTVSAAAIAVVLFLMFTHLATQRYEVDFLPLGVLAALVCFAIVHGRLSGWRGRAITGAFVSLVAYSATANLALAFSGPYDEMLQNRPAGYVRIARWFSPIAEFRPMLDPEVSIEIATTFIPQPNGFREPLVSIGGRHSSWFLYAERVNGQVILVSQADGPQSTYNLPAGPAHLSVTYAPHVRIMTVAVDGATVMQDRLPALVTAPAEVMIGADRAMPDATGAAFTGKIEVVRQLIRQ